MTVGDHNWALGLRINGRELAPEYRKTAIEATRVMCFAASPASLMPGFRLVRGSVVLGSGPAPCWARAAPAPAATAVTATSAHAARREARDDGTASLMGINPRVSGKRPAPSGDRAGRACG